MPPFVRFLIAVLMEFPALILWLIGMHQAFVGAWLFGEQRSAPNYLKLNLDWRLVAWPLAAMSASYLMFEFGGLLRGKWRLGKSPAHMAKAAALHWFWQVVALLAFFGGVACYHSAKRQAAGTATFGVICGLALGALIFGFFLSLKWSRDHAKCSVGDDCEPV